MPERVVISNKERPLTLNERFATLNPQPRVAVKKKVLTIKQNPRKRMMEEKQKQDRRRLMEQKRQASVVEGEEEAGDVDEEMAVVDEDNKGDRWLTEARAAGERLVEDSEAVREGVPTKAAEEDEIIVAVVMAREAAVDVDVADVVDVVDVAARKEKLSDQGEGPK
eukprot:CAMPEP_0185254428 /NCGR_PEP_ID=MMETSP1359-20130426/3211_1 /TAXON_ID=552665 /ORGANISM="Bigelowiella longifila, Strain CCMP242" /LENGTH=165 /DNA_ID=CAMNT_0027837413 /DNA_START=95 /DNA_END=594 /DNA_ORIENTATION=+